MTTKQWNFIKFLNRNIGENVVQFNIGGIDRFFIGTITKPQTQNNPFITVVGIEITDVMKESSNTTTPDELSAKIATLLEQRETLRMEIPLIHCSGIYTLY